MDSRLNLLRAWLELNLDEPLTSLVPASADASFRRYFRVTTTTTSYVAMDAPPEKEPVDAFIAIAGALTKQGVHSPKIFKQDLELGFLLLEDLGDRVYLNELGTSSEILYQQAIDSLVKIQLGQNAQPEFKLPVYQQSKLVEEMDLFNNWYVQKHLSKELSNEQNKTWIHLKKFLVKASLEQPQVWVHRDFHSRNLMIVNQNTPAVIDFQDMVIGPIAYDLASIFKDCYIEWPREVQLIWCERYYKATLEAQPNLKFTLSDLVRWFDLCGLQRHLKVLGIFCRLNYRDNKPQYMNDLPLVRKYVEEVLARYAELYDFSLLFIDLHN